MENGNFFFLLSFNSCVRVCDNFYLGNKSLWQFLCCAYNELRSFLCNVLNAQRKVLLKLLLMFTNTHTHNSAFISKFISQTFSIVLRVVNYLRHEKPHKKNLSRMKCRVVFVGGWAYTTYVNLFRFLMDEINAISRPLETIDHSFSSLGSNVSVCSSLAKNNILRISNKMLLTFDLFVLCERLITRKHVFVTNRSKCSWANIRFSAISFSVSVVVGRFFV